MEIKKDVKELKNIIKDLENEKVNLDWYYENFEIILLK